MIAIIDYGMGNLLSVHNALQMLGAEARICSNVEQLGDPARIVLPGVGAFRDCIHNLNERGFVKALNEQVLQRGKPILGICLGMQVMGRSSVEGGLHDGLGWFDADVVRVTPFDPCLRVPHIGWNETIYRPESPLFLRLPSKVDFYFVHSYHMKCDREADVEATCDHGGIVTAAVRRDNIFATQFHPEKSQDRGLRVLENFLNWTP